MKEYPPDKVRNVALIGHGSTGKTSLAEAMLFASGATTRLGRVEDGTTVSDWDPDEQKRGLSVNLAVVPVEAGGHKINVVDAPAYADFMGEAKCALRAADLALIVVCGASGVQVGTEFAWQFAEELSLPRAVFINRMDRENADFNATLGQLQSNWGQKCVPLQIPVGSQHALKGVVDLLAMKAYVGEKAEQQNTPAELAGEANAHREKLIEAAAETDDALIEKYLGGDELTPEELATGGRAGTLPPASGRAGEDGRRYAKGGRLRPPGGAGVQDRRRPLRGAAHLLPRALRDVQGGFAGLERQPAGGGWRRATSAPWRS